MAFALYMDVHVPIQITEGLRRRGLDVMTSQDDRTAEHPDEALLERAMELRRVLITQDEDFLAICPKWQQSAREFWGVVFVPQGTGIGIAVHDLELLSKCAELDEVRNRITHVPLR